MDIIYDLLNDKKTYIIAIILFIIAMIIALLVIWWPEGNDKINKYTYDEQQSFASTANHYFEVFINNLKFNTDEYFAYNISDDYLEYNNLSVSQLRNKLKLVGRYNVTDLTTYNANDIVIYSANLIDTVKTTRINIIESYPYRDYYITFDTFFGYHKSNKTYSSKGIEFTVNSIYQDMNYIEYDVKIHNKSNQFISIDFEASTGIYVTLNDGTIYYLSNIESDADLSMLRMNDFVSKDLIFTVPAINQSQIASLTILQVNVSGSIMDINIKF